MEVDVPDRPGNRAVVRVLTVVGAVLLLLTAVTVQARDSLFDSDEFADRVVSAASTPEVRDEITHQIVDEIVAGDADLLLYRPVIEGIVEALVESDVFEDILQFGIADLHRSVFTNSNDTLTVVLSDMVLLVKVSLSKVDAEAPTAIPDELTDAVISVKLNPALVDVAQFAEELRVLAFVLPVLVFASFAGAIWLARDRRTATIEVGVATVAVGVVLAAVEAIARAIVVNGADDRSSQVVIASLWDALLGDLVLIGVGMVVVGGVVAGAAVLWRRRVDDVSVGAMVGSVLRPPTTRRGGVIWSVVVAIIGIIAITRWDLAVQLAMAILGAGLVAMAAAEFRNALARPKRGAGARTGQGRSRVLTGALGVTAAVAGLAVVLLLIARSGGDDRLAAADAPGCNGSVLLCERPLDQVAFATTHNSMAAANDGFTMGYQTVGIIEQLDDGYRGLLLDAYFGLESDDLVVTDRAPLDEAERAELVADFGEGVVRSAEALRESLLGSGDERDVYLCHSFCEIGAVKMSDEMARVASWLDAHPREVLVVIIQDEGPQDVDIERVFREAGLIDMVHTQAIDEPWPSLGDMIRSGRRIWVSAENRPGNLPWYHDAFTFVQDTPYSAQRPVDFSCDLFRGEPDSPLFLINHWLSPVSPSKADIANSRPVLEARLEDCDRERGLFPNMIAVDFSDRGDTLAVVDELNGLDGPG